MTTSVLCVAAGMAAYLRIHDGFTSAPALPIGRAFIVWPMELSDPSDQLRLTL